MNKLPSGPDKEDALEALKNLRREAHTDDRLKRVQRYLQTLEDLLPRSAALAKAQFVRPQSGAHSTVIRALSGSTLVINTGSGAVAMQGGVAAGQGGVAVGGDVTTSQTASSAESQVLQRFIEWVKAQSAESVSVGGRCIRR